MTEGLRPYPAFKDSGVPWLGQVPAHWGVRRLKTLFREVDERTASGSEPLLSLRMHSGLVEHLAAGGRPIASENLVGFKRTKPGQIVMNRMRAASGLFAATKQDGLVSPDYAVLQPLDALSLDYYVHLFKTPPIAAELRRESKGLGTGESGFLRLYTDRFGAIRVPFPSFDEQAALARFLGHLDGRVGRYIRSKQKLIALLNEQKQAIIHRAVTRGLDPTVRLKPSGVDWLGKVPAHWDVRPLRQCGELRGGMTPSMQDPTFWDGSVPWITPKDMKRRILSDSELHVSDHALKGTALRLIPAGSVLLVVRGMILARHVPIARTTAAVTINQDMKALVPAPEVAPEFLAIAMDSAQDAFRPLINHAGHGTCRLPTERWRNLAIALPPLREQQEIARSSGASTAALERAAEIATTELGFVREWRTRLSADVVTGRLDVRDAETRLQASWDDETVTGLETARGSDSDEDQADESAYETLAEEGKS